jgi:hypothetical protein
VIIDLQRDSEFDRRMIRHRVFLDGVDITADCFYVDTEAGLVRRYIRNADGLLSVNEKGELPSEEVRGHVEVMPPLTDAVH